MDTASAMRLRNSLRDDRGGTVHRRTVDRPGFPCRHCLRNGIAGETMLLASWDLPLPQGPYWTPSPIFLHAADCPRAAIVDTLPETVLRNPLVSLRHYDAGGMCLYEHGIVLPGEQAEGPLRQRLGDPRVAFVNIHTARPGCWLARVERL